MSDTGEQFAARVFHGFNISLILHSSYHPQSNRVREDKLGDDEDPPVAVCQPSHSLVTVLSYPRCENISSLKNVATPDTGPF